MKTSLPKGKKVTLFVIGFIISCLLVPMASEYANTWRGYHAVGGEVLIPVLYLIVVGLIKEIGGVIDGQF